MLTDPSSHPSSQKGLRSVEARKHSLRIRLIGRKLLLVLSLTPLKGVHMMSHMRGISTAVIIAGKQLGGFIITATRIAIRGRLRGEVRGFVNGGLGWGEVEEQLRFNM
jgi:hypothetical protein